MVERTDRESYEISTGVLERTALRNNGAYSVFMDSTGEPRVYRYIDYVRNHHHDYSRLPARSQSRIISAGIVAANIISGKPLDYSELSVGSEDTRCAEFADGLYNFTFVPELTHLPKRGELVLDECLELAETPRMEAIEILKKAIAAADEFFKRGLFYTPYLDHEGNPIEVNTLVAQKVDEIKAKIKILEDVPDEVFGQRVRPGIIVSQAAWLHMLPTEVPFGAAWDVDSGQCNVNTPSSCALGEECFVLTTVGSYTLVKMNKRHGLILTDKLAQLSDLPEKDGYQTVTYAHPSILYLPRASRNDFHQIFPGDPLFERDGVYHTLIQGGGGMVGYARLFDEDIQPYALSQRVIAQPSEPKDFVRLIDHHLPYIASLADCSEMMRRLFASLGYDVPKYSRDMMKALEAVGIDPAVVGSDNNWDVLNDGLFVGELRQMRADATFASTHLYLIQKQGEQVQAVSQAFGMLSDDGQVEYPVGIDFRNRADLAAQFGKNRKIATYRIAS